MNTLEFECVSNEVVFFLFFSLQYVVVTVCLKAGLETTAWTRVSTSQYILFFLAHLPP